MILIISSPDDVHAQAVVRELATNKTPDVRLLNLSEFPMRLTMSMHFSKAKGSPGASSCSPMGNMYPCRRLQRCGGGDPDHLGSPPH